MERTQLAAHRWRLILLSAGAALGAWLLRDALRMLAAEVLAASILMVLALPLCRLLERKLPGGLSAALSLLGLLLGAAAVLVGVIPPVARQVRQLAETLPVMLSGAQDVLKQTGAWLADRGVPITALGEGLLGPLSDAAGKLVARMMGAVSGLISGVGQMVLSPLLAFYLLKDRRRISSALTLLLPVPYRARGVRAAREMKRETAAFLRGQMLLSLAVGSMTALGLAVIGVPGWLLLGLLMAVLELVPYIGPLIAGLPAVLSALSGGWGKALLTLVLLVAVQEIEGAVLSPRLVGRATALHPLTVLLAVSAGGMIAGALGMMLVIPAIVSVRGALRGWRE